MRGSQTLVGLLGALFLAACGVEGMDPSLASAGAIEETTAESFDELGYSKGRFETFNTDDNRHYFHLVAGNGERVLASQSYTQTSSALNGIASVKTNGVDKSRYSLRETSYGDWYFVLAARNNEVIASSEVYASKWNAERGIDTVIRVITNTVTQGPAPVAKAHFDVFSGSNGEFYFHVRAGNGEIVLKSEGYTTKYSAVRATETVQRIGAEPARYKVLEASNGQFYFVLRADNGEPLGNSEMFESAAIAALRADTCAALFATGDL